MANAINGHENKRPLFINVILKAKRPSEFGGKRKFPGDMLLANVGTENALLSHAECDYRLIHNENVCSELSRARHSSSRAHSRTCIVCTSEDLRRETIASINP